MQDNTNDAQQIYQTVQELFQERNDIRLLETAVPKTVVYQVASTHGPPLISWSTVHLPIDKALANSISQGEQFLQVPAIEVPGDRSEQDQVSARSGRLHLAGAHELYAESH